MHDKKISGFGYVCCLDKHTNVECLETDTGEQYIELEGFVSRKVKSLFALDENENLVVWQLVREIDSLLKEMYQQNRS